MSINAVPGAGISLSLFSVALVAVAGCSNLPPRIGAPAYSPGSIASAAMAEFDTNQDGSLDAAELDKSPSLKGSLALLDKNGDQKVSADEIAARVQAWKDGNLAVIPCNCVVTLDGAKLSDATVTFVPEKFMGAGFKSATGKSTSEGIAAMSSDGLESNGVKLFGVYSGFYKVTISKADNNTETLPDRYNAQTTLGIEVGPDVPALKSAVKFDLTK